MSDVQFLRLAFRLARRGHGKTSPNPMVGAVLVKSGKIIGRGWHRRAGEPHAEIEALRDALRRGCPLRDATLYVTLEPCCTHGRTPPCTDALISAGIRRVVVGTVDPNPQHAGKAFKILKRAGIEAISIADDCSFGRDQVVSRTVGRGSKERAPRLRLADECVRLNEAFNHWIVRRTPFVTIKAAMTLDGKIAAADGESKWITAHQARACGMKLRQGNDAILVGINTILADDPSLMVRRPKAKSERQREKQRLRRIILDSLARTPLDAKVASDDCAHLTTVVVSKFAPPLRVAALARRVNVVVAPASEAKSQIQNTTLDLTWLLRKLGGENVTNLLVEGGGEVNASFLEQRLANRIVFFFAPKILGGRHSRKAVAGVGAGNLSEAIQLRETAWRQLGPDLMLTARVD